MWHQTLSPSSPLVSPPYQQHCCHLELVRSAESCGSSGPPVSEPAFHQGSPGERGWPTASKETGLSHAITRNRLLPATWICLEMVCPGPLERTNPPAHISINGLWVSGNPARVCWTSDLQNWELFNKCFKLLNVLSRERKWTQEFTREEWSVWSFNP